MDSLSEILKSIKAHHSRAGIMRLSEPWGLAVEVSMTAAYGVAAGGPCWVCLPDRGEAIRLDQGDIILVTVPHLLLSSLDVPPADLVDILMQRGRRTNPKFSLDDEPDGPQHLRWGGGGRETRMLGLTFGMVRDTRNPLLRALPRCIVLRASSGQFPWMPGAIEFLTSGHADSPGYTATLRLLSELVLVSIVRSYLLNESQVAPGWLRGLTDPGIGRTLQAMHEKPGNDWTVRELAQVAGQSRTTFATRFAELLQVTPIEYLTQWRMHLAAEQLLASRANLSRLATELGYASDTAFRNAFKRRYGMVPSRFRGTGAAQPAMGSNASAGISNPGRAVKTSPRA